MNEEKSSSTWLSRLIPLLLMMLSGGTLIQPQPFKTAKHSSSLETFSGAKDSKTETTNTYFSRLWQDPFAAITTKTEAGTTPAPDFHNTKLVMVMVTGSPTSDGDEWRRRYRHATVAGLQESGWAPEDSEHIQVMRWTEDCNQQLGDMVIPYEVFKRKPGARLPGACEENEKLVIAWLKDEEFESYPARKLKLVANAITLASKARPLAHIDVIGPWSSSTLIGLTAEGNNRPCLPGLPRITMWSPSSTVSDELLMTVDDPNQPKKRPSRQALATTVGELVEFHNLTCTDRELTKALWAELCLRSESRHGRSIDWATPYIDCGANKKNRENVVLLSEMDTLYGRSVSQVMEELRNDNVELKASFQVTSFVYERGMDGEITRGNAKSESDDSKSGDNKKQSRGEMEQAFGPSMLDYTRRLAVRIRSEMKENKVFAFGIFGTDVYDKVLLVEALRPLFPGVIFFTTDLDGRMMDDDHRDACRNMIVASSYGWRLTKHLQGGAAPFRDSYQTAVFLAAQCAGGRLTCTANELSDHSPSPQQVEDEGDSLNLNYSLTDSEGNPIPRVFEIGRIEPIEPVSSTKIKSPTKTVHPVFTAPLSGNWWKSASWNTIVALLISGSLILLTILCLRDLSSIEAISRISGFKDQVSHLFLLVCRELCGDRRDLPPNPNARKVEHSKQQWWVIACFGVGVLVALAAGIDTTRSNGEVFHVMSGTSIWPSILLRGFGLALTLLLIARCWWVLETNWTRIVSEFNLDCDNTNLLLQPSDGPPKAWSIARRLLAPIIGERDDFYAAFNHDSKGIVAARVLRQYRNEDGREFTIMRCRTRWFLYLAVAILSWTVMENAVEPFRGSISYWTNELLNFLYPLAYAALVIYVAYATQLVTRLVDLLTTLPTKWPVSTLKTFNHSEGTPGFPNLDEFIDIKFIAARSEAVGQMIYYPFISLLILILARNPWFDRWQWSLPIIALFSIHALYAIGCAIMLRWAAEEARKKALESLQEKLLIAEASNSSTAPKIQLEHIIDHVKNCQQGAFASFSSQPWITAALLPAGGAGLLNLLHWL